MKRIMFFAFGVFLAMAGYAQRWDNYLPDNTNVRLNETNLPIVFLDVDGNMIDRYERITAHMKIIDNGDGQLNYADTVAHPDQRIDYDGYVAIRYRGNTSFTSSDKKPYSFRTLDKALEDGGVKTKVKILGMGKDNNWAMLAPYSDKSMMRDLLAFELSRPWMDYAPHGKFCEMILDGTYYGVYIMCEVVSKGKKRLNLDDPGEQGDELTGGYLLEVDRTDEETYTSKYHPVSKTGTQYRWKYINFQYKSPEYDEMTDSQLNYIHGAIDAMEDAFAASDYADPVNGYAKYIDVQSFMDYQLAQEFAHNVDGYRLSCKIYKHRESVDDRFKLVLWDFNLGYGNSDYYNGWRTDSWIYQNNDLLNQNGDSQLIPFWWYKLNKDENYTAALKARWAAYRRSNFRDDRLMNLVDSMATVLTSNGAETRNSRAWPRWGQYVWPNEYIASNYEDEVAYLKSWLTDRLTWMDEQLGYDPTALLTGDVTGDGKVDVADVNAAINIILKVKNSQDYPGSADISDDGKVDVTDVNAIINLILRS